MWGRHAGTRGSHHTPDPCSPARCHRQDGWPCTTRTAGRSTTGTRTATRPPTSAQRGQVLRCDLVLPALALALAPRPSPLPAPFGAPASARRCSSSGGAASKGGSIEVQGPQDASASTCAADGVLPCLPCPVSGGPSRRPLPATRLGWASLVFGQAAAAPTTPHPPPPPADMAGRWTGGPECLPLRGRQAAPAAAPVRACAQAPRPGRRPPPPTLQGQSGAAALCQWPLCGV